MNGNPDRFVLVDRSVEAAGPGTLMGAYPTRAGAEDRMREQYRTYSFMYLGPLASHELVIIDTQPPVFKRPGLWARLVEWRRSRHRQAVAAMQRVLTENDSARLRGYRSDPDGERR